MNWIRSIRFWLVCVTLLVCATSRADSPVRIGWIDDFSGLGITADQVDLLDARIRSFWRCGYGEPAIVLADCPAERVSVDERTMEGVCGQTLDLPAACDLSTRSRLLRGVWMASVRPGHDQRQNWLTRHQAADKAAAADRWPTLSADDVPCDVIVSIAGNGDWFIGCDVDLDLQFQSDEQFHIPANQVGNAQVVRCHEDVLLLQAEVMDNVPTLAMACVSGATAVQRSDPRRLPIVDVVGKNFRRDTQWQLFASDNGPANIVVAMEAAARAECDLVLVNLHGRQRNTTDVARLLAELSRSLRLPVVVNVPTPLSPNYFIEPARLSIPDNAEFQQQPNPPSKQAFETAVAETIEQHAARVQVTQAAPLTEQAHGGPQTLPVGERSGSPQTLGVTSVDRVSVLQNVPSALVPEAVREAAKDLLNRSSQVATFWYREAPRDGDDTLRHLFQTVESQRVWPNRLLQFAVIYENGRINRRDHAIGDSATSNPMTGWILLQAAIPASAHPADTNVSTLSHAKAPELLQRWPVGSTAGQATEQWSRVDLYDHDPQAEVIQLRKQQGQTAQEVLQATDKPGDDSADIVAWRQYLLALDQPELRKQHLDRVVQTAGRVLELCKQSLGVPRPTSEAQQQVYAWAVDAVYRQVRAIGYRELPEVIAQHPIEDWEMQNAAYESAFYQLCGMVDIKDPRFVLTLVRYHRRRGEPWQAYEALKWHAYEGPSLPWYFKKERDLFRDSGSEPLARLGSARWFLRENGYGVPDRQP